ncbi:NupC/NupG family nucleoside CNT transporter [Piscirickettsia salmonis]|uniref:NupC/NupG family nucleoside CNT transporter n=1 Tax=Piscirickettsia salmonis TaxID=1238 RepID=UPI001E5BDD2F|nr:nucleoside transporter C-terminal domain-containing protein [Piscirickettsia salmonis]
MGIFTSQALTKVSNNMIQSVLHGILGLLGFCLLAFIFSENKRAIKWKPVGYGLIAQVIIALILFYVPLFSLAFAKMNEVIIALQQSVIEATSTVFGYIGGGPSPFEVKPGGNTFILALQALPMVIVIGAIGAILTYWGIIPFIIRHISKALHRFAGIGGALGTVLSANIFLGFPEAQLTIRGYLKHLTRSEIFTMMTMGLAAVAGTVMGLYVIFLQPIFPNGVIGYVITSVVMGIPAVITISRIMVSETETVTTNQTDLTHESASSTMDALTQGIFEGGKTLMAIIIMMLAALALVSFINHGLALLPHIYGHTVSVQLLLSYLLVPFMWLMGIPWEHAQMAAELMATKLATNELIAYSQLATMHHLDPRVQIVMVFAMCGFANFGSIGSMLGSFTSLMPEKRKIIVNFGFKAMLAGTIVTCMNGTVVGALYSLGVPIIHN